MGRSQKTTTRDAKPRNGGDSDESASPVASQDLQEAAVRDIHNLMKQHTTKVRERRKFRKEEILITHAEGVQNLRNQVELHRRARSQRRTALRQPLLIQLVELVRKKQAINGKIAQVRKELLRAVEGATTRLKFAVDDRIASHSM